MRSPSPPVSKIMVGCSSSCVVGTNKGKVAQFPREVEVSVDLTPLFKERPVTGMANFGHAPRDLKNIGLVGGFNNEFSEALTVNRV